MNADDLLKRTLRYLQKTDAVNTLSEDIEKYLAEPKDEPVAWMWDVYNGAGYTSRGIGFQQTDIPFAKHTPLYTHPDPDALNASYIMGVQDGKKVRDWVELTDEEYLLLADRISDAV